LVLCQKTKSILPPEHRAHLAEADDFTLIESLIQPQQAQ
jgi:hypothetical protein